MVQAQLKHQCGLFAQNEDNSVTFELSYGNVTTRSFHLMDRDWIALIAGVVMTISEITEKEFWKRMKAVLKHSRASKMADNPIYCGKYQRRFVEEIATTGISLWLSSEKPLPWRIEYA